MAGLGPIGLLWVGFATFLMSTKESGVLLLANDGIWLWALVYPVINVILLAIHYNVTPSIYAWLAVTPIEKNEIDELEPWSEPYLYG